MKKSERKLEMVTALVAKSHGFVLAKPKKGEEKLPICPRHMIFLTFAEKIIDAIENFDKKCTEQTEETQRAIHQLLTQ